MFKYNENHSVVENNAKWFGFAKAEDDENKVDSDTLPHLIRWNIIYILFVTLWSVILVRQFNYRASRGKPTTRAFFLFPRVNRAEADRDLKTCLKYLANYGFYKFGVEVSLLERGECVGYIVNFW